MSDADPTTPDAENDSHFHLLDLSGPSEPELPRWAALAIAAVAAILPIPPDVALAALEALLPPIRLQPEGAPKAAVRAAVRAKEAEIRAARVALAAAQPLSATVEQPIPVVRDVPPVATATAPALVTPYVHTGAWVPLVALPGGDYRETRGRNERSDVWGCRVETSVGRRAFVGDPVRIYRRGDSTGRVHAITGMVRQGSDHCIALVSSTRADVDRALAPRPTAPQPRQPLPATSTNAERVQRMVEDGLADASDTRMAAALMDAYDHVPERAAESDQEPAGMLETSLAGIAAQGTTLATATRETSFVEPTTRGDGSQQAADTSGIVHTPTGPSIFEQPREQRVFRVGETTTKAQVRSLLNERDFIAGAAAAEGGMLQTSWDGSIRSQTELGLFTDALREIGREDDAPGVPSGEAYAGKAVAAVGGGRGFNTQRLLKTQITEKGIKAEWQIGDGRARTDVQAGDAFGRVALVVKLREDDTLAFDGDLTLASAVRTTYATMVAKETLKSDVLTAWLQRILRTRHAGVKRGRVWYIPSGQAEAVQTLIDAISPLWGDHETIRVTTAKALAKSLSRGLSDELAKVEKDFDDATDRARAAARTQAEKKAGKVYNATAEYIAAEGQTAFDRATVSSIVAASLLRDLGTVAARVAGYETVLGTEAVTGVSGRIATLRGRLMPLTDDTSARAAMLELE